MHCVSCEKLLETEFRAIKNVQQVQISYKKGEAEIRYKNQKPDFTLLARIAKKFGYQAFETKQEKSIISKKAKTTWREWLSAVLATGGIILLFRAFQNMGILDRIDIGNGSISYGVSFLVGLVASVSSCLVVVGAVVIAFGEKYQGEGKSFFATVIKPNLAFHAGRLGTFFVLGGLLGLIGGEISVSGNAMAILTIFVSLVMVLLGLNILGTIPSLSTLGIGMPKGFTKHWGALRESEHRAAPFLLGGLSFLLPCGFTQSMQIYALSSSGFLSGGLNLFFFALGTVPALFLLGVTASWTSNKKMVIFQKVAGFLIVIFAIYTFTSGASLLGVDSAVLQSDSKMETVAIREKPNNVSNKAVSKGNKESQSGVVVKMSVTSKGFEPNVLRVKRGTPVHWVIEGKQVSGCTNKIIIPQLDKTINIKKGENVLDFTPTEKGTISFGCWMGMVRGKFIVE